MDAPTLEFPRLDPRTDAARAARLARVTREIVGCAIVVAMWIVLWMYAATTVTAPWAPDPETRAAMAETTPTATAQR